MYSFRNWLFIGLLSLLLIFAFIGCGDDDDEEEELLAASKSVYIINGAAQTLSVFDIETSEMQNDVLTVGKWPNDIQIVDNQAYIVNTGDNSVQIIDLETLTETGVMDIGEGTAPEKIGFAGGKAYVSCNYTAAVNVVDLASGQVTKTIEVGMAPWGVAAVGQKVYVCNTNAVFDVDSGAMSYGDSTVSVIDSSTDEVVATIDVGNNATEIVAVGDKIVVQCTGNYGDVMGKLSVIETASDAVSQTIDLGTTPSGLAASPNGKVYVTSFGGLISVDVDSGSVSVPLADFGGGSGLAFDADGNGYISVPDWTGEGGDKLLVIDSSENLAGTYVPGGGASIVVVRD